MILAKQTKTILAIHKLKGTIEDDFAAEINKLVTSFKFKELNVAK